ncbi:MAG TPA: tripartite tricarboxylate transporter substrate binding protein [Burkholderiales bacterium]|nr:tripartite tricarboxylate transporter substrate binding protein [Burkholderiales bacterium]
MKRISTVVAALALAAFAATATAQDRTLKFVLGYPAGASSDVLTRLLAQKMGASLGATTIVENKTGANGIIGTEAVKNAPPDGSTLLMSPLAPMVAFPHSHGKLIRYDPFKDFAPVAHLANFQIAMVVNAELPVKTVADYVALVKKDPGAGNYASAAAGSLPHYVGVMFARASGLTMTHVPYRGTAPGEQALASGEVKAAMFVLADALTLVRNGKGRLLAVAGAARSPMAPDTPTFKELGYDIEASAWYALFAPAGTPKELIDRYARAAIEAVQSPDMKKKLQDMGLEPTGLGPEVLAKVLRSDYDKWGPVIKASGFKPGN